MQLIDYLLMVRYEGHRPVIKLGFVALMIPLQLDTKTDKMAGQWVWLS